VLVVESGADAAATLTAMLRLNGFDARTVPTGAAALRAVAETNPQVVVIDLDLPDADGCDVIRRVRSRVDAPAVVVVTGYTDMARKRAATQAGATAYLLKPADPSDLVRLVKHLCGPTSGT
jgi:DNA-binding response OmpR family regulator